MISPCFIVDFNARCNMVLICSITITHLLTDFAIIFTILFVQGGCTLLLRRMMTDEMNDAICLCHGAKVATGTG